MARRKPVDRAVLIGAVLGSLVLVNFVSVGIFGRLDLTRDKRFTLSQATKDTVRSLDDPLTIRAYFSQGMPPPYSTNQRYVRDLLEEYFARSNGNFRYEFIDPSQAESDEEKEKKKKVRRDIFGRTVRDATNIERELQELGIPPIEVQVNEDDKIEIKRGYMGLAISYGEDREVIPVVQNTAGLEYDLTTLIRKLTREKIPKIALLTGHDEPSLNEEMGRFYGLLTQLYDVTPLDLSATPEIDQDVDAVLVVGPKTPLSEEEQIALDDFIMSGRSVAFLLDSVSPELGRLRTQTADHGLTDLLATYGVRIEPGLVLDVECATIGVQRQLGFMRVSQPVRYPFLPVPRTLDPEHPLTRGLSEVAFAFMSPLSIALGEESGVDAEILVRSSDQSWVETPPYNLNPTQQWVVDPSRQSSQALVISLMGPIQSHFRSDGSANGEPVEPAERSDLAANARILVAGGASFVTDQFITASRQNVAFVFNLLDWLVLDEDLLQVRSRGLGAAALEEIGSRTRSTVKYLNVLGLPLGFVAFGLFRWRRREARRARVTL